MVALMLKGWHRLVRYTAVLLSLISAGCASVAPAPATTPPPVAATQPAAPKPAATPAKPATPPTAPRVAAPRATATPPARAPRLPATKPVAVPTATAAPLDLKALEVQLRATKAIGVFTKISLKNQVDDLMKQFREHYGGKATRTMSELRRSYDLLIMKVLSLLQDDDQVLASAIVSSREAIWGLLSDQNKFATL
jgi:hypothetical protein